MPGVGIAPEIFRIRICRHCGSAPLRFLDFAGYDKMQGDPTRPLAESADKPDIDDPIGIADPHHNAIIVAGQNSTKVPDDHAALS